MSKQIRRRNVLSGIGVATTAGLLAGCSTDTQNGGDGGDGGTGTDGADGGSGDGGSGGVPSAVSEYLSDVSNFEGSLDDVTGQENPTVTVGGNSDLLYKPSAIRISSGTTVTWEWAGGRHNVVHEGGDFESEFHTGSGPTFEYTFDESGNYRYYCTPHKPQGMKGAVVVE